MCVSIGGGGGGGGGGGPRLDKGPAMRAQEKRHSCCPPPAAGAAAALEHPKHPKRGAALSVHWLIIHNSCSHFMQVSGLPLHNHHLHPAALHGLNTLPRAKRGRRRRRGGAPRGGAGAHLCMRATARCPAWLLRGSHSPLLWASAARLARCVQCWVVFPAAAGCLPLWKACSALHTAHARLAQWPRGCRLIQRQMCLEVPYDMPSCAL